MVNQSLRKVLFVFSALLLCGCVTASAEDCGRRVHRAEMQLQQAVQRHGAHSRQAEQRRHELEQARASCHR